MGRKRVGWEQSWAERLYRLALRSLPVRARQGFGSSMLSDFRALAEECQGRPARLVRVAVRESCNVFWAGMKERLKGLKRSGKREAMINDLKFACRSLSRNPGLMVAVLLTVGLGIGIASAVFSVVDHVLLRPLPYPEPDRLVRVWGADRKSGRRFQELSFQDFQALQQEARSFSSLAAFSLAPRRLEDEEGHPSTVTVARISEGFLKLLGAQLERGRAISPPEFQRRAKVAVLSHALWQGRFGGRDDVLQADIQVRNQVHRVIGVLPADWEYPPKADLFRPLYEPEMQDDDREFFVLARLAPVVSAAQAASEAAAIIERRADADPRTRGSYTAWVQPLQDMLVREARGPLLILLGAVSAVLLIVCLNVANLLLARGVTRRPEMALRSALGASRARLVRLVLWESLLLSLGGGLLGLLLGYAALEVLIAIAPGDIPRLLTVGLDGRVVAVMAAAALACGILAGVIPAWLDSRPSLHNGLASARRSSQGLQASRIRQGLVVFEVALATVLVVAAGLLASSFQRMIEFNRGFSQLSLLEVQIGPSERHTHGSAEGILQLYDGLVARLLSLPGVRSVALSSASPMNPGGLRVAVKVEGAEAPPQAGSAQLRFASHDFFAVAGIPLWDGRAFDPAIDRASSPRVAIVNRAFVQAFGLQAGAVGRTVALKSLGADAPDLRIVGAVEDLRPQVDSSPRPAVYVPFQQSPWAYMRLLVRLGGEPAQAAPMLREQIWSVAPDVSVDSIQTLERMVSETLSGPRFSAALTGSFALLALILASLGLYGVVSYSVSRQAHELAIRQALGARRGNVVQLVLGRGLALLLAGAAAGIPAAASVAWLLSSQLYGVSPADLPAWLPAILILFSAGALACLLPARRALLIDPALILRDE